MLKKLAALNPTVASLVSLVGNVLFITAMCISMFAEEPRSASTNFTIVGLLLFALLIAVYDVWYNHINKPVNECLFEDKYDDLVHQLTNGVLDADAPVEAVLQYVDEDTDTIVKLAVGEIIEENELLANAIIDREEGDCPFSAHELATAYHIVSSGVTETMR